MLQPAPMPRSSADSATKSSDELRSSDASRSHGDRHEHTAGDRPGAVPARARDQATGDEGAEGGAEHERHEHQARPGGADLAHLLHELGDEEDPAPEQEAAREVDAGGRSHHRVAEEDERQDGLGRAPLAAHEQPAEQHHQGDQGDGAGRPPGDLVAAEGREQDEQRQTRGEERGTRQSRACGMRR